VPEMKYAFIRTRLAKHTVDGSLGEWVGYFSLLAAYVAGVSCSRL